MSDEIDPSTICLDEDCDREGIHRKHLVAKRPPPEPHHRPSRQPLWKQDDPQGLIEALIRTTSGGQPFKIDEIFRGVRDDYGSVSERTVYRYVNRLVDAGLLVKIESKRERRRRESSNYSRHRIVAKINLGLSFSAYIKPGARLLGDPEAMREYILGEIEFGKGCTGKQRYA